MSTDPNASVSASAPLPAPVAAAGAVSARALDVRPLLAKGADPFALIMKTVAELSQQEALHLIVAFEPRPLYAVMKMSGRAAHTEQQDGAYHVWFYRDASLVETPSAAERVPLKPPVDLDVRGL